MTVDVHNKPIKTLKWAVKSVAKQKMRLQQCLTSPINYYVEYDDFKQSFLKVCQNVLDFYIYWTLVDIMSTFILVHILKRIIFYLHYWFHFILQVCNFFSFLKIIFKEVCQKVTKQKYSGWYTQAD